MSWHWRNLIFFVFTMNFAVTYVRTDWLVKCGPCKCKWNSGKKTADCKNTSISRVPLNLSSELQVLDLSSNVIGDIRSREFVTADLRNLHKLFVRNCSLKSIARDGLMGLEILIELDLSYNLLTTVPKGMFSSLVKLRVLMINNNHIQQLDDGTFRNLKFLHKIELKDNLLIRISNRAFTNLPVLSQIYLDGNEFTILKREAFEELPKLTSLSLKLNPWNCSCELKPFRDFTFQQNLYTPPTDCYYPPHLRGTLWTDAVPDAFSCKPEVLYPTGAGKTVNAIGDNVTLSCRFHSSPNTVLTWTYNKHSLTNYPKRIYIKNVSELNEQDSMELLTSELTIVGVKKSDEGTYTCISHNVGGRAHVDIVLTVKRKLLDNQFISNNLLFMLCLIAVGLLVASLIIMAITCCYCRKFRKLAKQDLDNKKQFEAIKLNSFNNASLANGGTTTEFELQKQQQQQQHHHHHQHQHQQQSSTEFCQAEKSDQIGSETHEIKCALLGDTLLSDNRFEVSLDKSNGVVLSPTRQTLTYEQHDTRLPPDLLPYGPPSMALQNTTSLLDNDQYITYEKSVLYNNENLSNENSSLKDLHIYQDCGNSYGIVEPVAAQPQPLSSSCLRSTSATVTINGKQDMLCKPRQSIVRTSPSFSFLSTGYQQQNNFL